MYHNSINFLFFYEVQKCQVCGASIPEQLEHEAEVKDLEVGHVSVPTPVCQGGYIPLAGECIYPCLGRESEESLASTWQGEGEVLSLLPEVQSVPGYRRPEHAPRG